MLSWPPAITISVSPALIDCDASATARKPETLAEFGQEHLLEGWGRLSERERNTLLHDIETARWAEVFEPVSGLYARKDALQEETAALIAAAALLPPPACGHATTANGAPVPGVLVFQISSIAASFSG